ncbi:MAG: hypothetical protein LBN95_03700 [Prevotellaceae bacterium]|jgi:hypothetical protein|nr:hypothetical protein [Prevotellaceae bacterium]
MANKVRVFGKAQNRTVQGIFNAYLIMYPNATLKDLNQAFPQELRWAKDDFPLFVDMKDAPKFDKIISRGERKGEKDNKFDFEYFTNAKDIFNLKDGTKAVMRQMWWEEAYKNVAKHAEQYGIEVANFEYREPFSKGEYRLEYLNGYVPPVSAKKQSKWWLWLLLGLLLVGGALCFLLK